MKRFNLYYLIFALLVVTYAVLVFKIPLGTAAATRYQLGDTQARLLSLTIVIPYAIIWFTAVFGFVRVKQYAALAKKGKDGAALKVVSDGLMLLAFSLPINAIAGTIRNYINAEHGEWTPEATIIYNYVSLALTLGGIWLVSHGAQKLIGTVKKPTLGWQHILAACAFTVFCVAYTYIALTDPALRSATGISGTASYYLPDALVFSTIIVPYICIWFLGLRAAYHIQLYRMRVPGLLYRRALGYLASGIAFTVISLMVLRLTTSLTSYLREVSLQFLLSFVYFLLIIIGIGYGLIAIGAKRLKKIEEV